MSFYDVAWWILVVLYIPACVGLIVIVLLQKGKGAGFAGAFGMGAGSDTVFGPRSRQSLPVRMTYVAATLFMVIALLMSIIAGRVGKGIAPELVEEVATTSESSLTDLGIGTGAAGAAAAPASGTEDGAVQEKSSVDLVITEPSSAGAVPTAGGDSSGGKAPGGGVSSTESSDGAEPSGTP